MCDTLEIVGGRATNDADNAPEGEDEETDGAH